MLNLVARRLWPRSLLGRLIVIVVVIDGIAAVTIGGVIVLQARTATVVETQSAMKTAELLVTDTIGVMKDAESSLLLQALDLHSASVRHVRIAVTDLSGQPVHAPVSGAAQQASFESSPPDWFARVISPAGIAKDIPVLLHNRLVGNVTVTSEPADEIGEAWHYARALLEAGLVLSLIVLLLASLLFGRVLAPLKDLASGLKRLEDRDYEIRLMPPALQDLAAITDHFNRAAEALDQANAANHLLNRQLVTAQDDERRRTALELHDEVGPCLFALNASVSSIAHLTRKFDGELPLRERAGEAIELVQRVQAINRRVLDRLRPMGLGHVPLRECVFKIIVDLSDEAGPTLTHFVGPLEDTYGRLADLTLYRCVQEGLFNAIRHAQSTEITLEIKELEDKRGARHISMLISDNGHGSANPPRFGIGLTGMRERLDALGGSFDFNSSSSGTRLSIAIPVERPGVGSSPEVSEA